MAGFDDPVLQHDQFGLQAEQFAEITNTFTGQFRCGQAVVCQAIVQLEFKFFVQAVEQVFTQLTHLIFVDTCVGGHGQALQILKFNLPWRDVNLMTFGNE